MFKSQLNVNNSFKFQNELSISEIKEFKKLISNMVSVRKKLGLKFNPNFIDEY